MDASVLLSSIPSKHELVDTVTYLSTAYTCWQVAAPKVKGFFFDFMPIVLGFFAAILKAAAEYLRSMKGGPPSV